MVLGIATVLGMMGVLASFILFDLGEKMFLLDRSHLQTLMYLKLSVAGHLTIFIVKLFAYRVFDPQKKPLLSRLKSNTL